MVPSTETSTNEVWTFGFVDGNIATGDTESPPVSLPGSSLTSTLFLAATEGGAAAYPPAWYRQTYNPPSHVVCSLNGNSSSDPSPTTNNSQGPVVIGPTEAGDTQG